LFSDFFFHQSWDDEDDNNGNGVSGTLPDGDFGGNTKYYYCTYGPSFRISFSFHSFCYLSINPN